MANKSPLIDQFKGPENNGPREETITDLPDFSKEEPGEIDVSPAKAYLEGLNAIDLSRAEAVAIIDAVVSDGIYLETVKINNRVVVEFGTRSYRDLQRVSRLLENESPTLPMSVNDLISRFNLAASLRSYNGKALPWNDKEKDQAVSKEFQERLDFIYGLPDIIVHRMMEALSEFDHKIGVVFAKGAPEDF
jgi:hypothetical protein